MVKHIVLFKLKENLSTEEKQAVIDKFKAAIEALPPVIPSIRKIYGITAELQQINATGFDN